MARYRVEYTAVYYVEAGDPDRAKFRADALLEHDASVGGVASTATVMERPLY